jgi:hypothetical protein
MRCVVRRAYSKELGPVEEKESLAALRTTNRMTQAKAAITQSFLMTVRAS